MESVAASTKKRKPKWYPLEEKEDSNEINRYKKRIKRLEQNVTTLSQALLALEDRLETIEDNLQFSDEESIDASIELSGGGDSDDEVKIIVNKLPERDSPGVSIHTDSSHADDEEDDDDEDDSTGVNTSDEEKDNSFGYKPGKATWFHADIMGNVHDYRTSHYIEDSDSFPELGHNLDNSVDKKKKETGPIILLEDDDEESVQ
jgi:hypothetical protein